MLVVADSSPINYLVRVGCADLLPTLFGTVLIPPEVVEELSWESTPPLVRAFIVSPPSWLLIRDSLSHERFPLLGPGETAAIHLAQEQHADALLIDDKDGRRVAQRLGIAIVGTLGFLERAADRNLLDLSEALDRLKASDFRVDPRLIQNALERDRLRRAKN